jgi:Protein of unknown function (DUF3054)
MRTAGAAIDLAAVLLFVAIGRHVHAHGLSVSGMASTAWPFLSGLGAGWIAVAVSRRDATSVPGGLVVCVSTVALGMVLRVISGQGTAAAFVFVTLGFLAAVMLSWRLLLAHAQRRSRVRRGLIGPGGGPQ